jgi:hypothetical protein
MDRPYEDAGAPPRADAGAMPRGFERAEARPSIAAPLLGIGGLGLVIGSLLTWIDAGDAARREINGGSISDGRLAMGIGFAMLIMAVYMATTRRYGHRYDADLLGATLGAIATTVVVATMVALPDGTSADLGLYVSLAGAVVGLVGALIALFRGETQRDVDVDSDRVA